MNARRVSLPDNWRAWPLDAKYRLLTRLNKVAAEQAKEVVTVLPEAKAIEAQGWRVWYAAVFGQAFVDALDSAETKDCHHSEAIGWHWDSRRALIVIELGTRTLNAQLAQKSISPKDYRNQIATLEELRPEFLAYFTIWARGNLKTTILRRIAVCDACLSVSAGVAGYALIVGGTKAKIRSTANSINALLTKPLSARGSEVWKYYPQLAEVRRNKFGHSQGWTTDLFMTNADYVFHFAGLEEGLAGANEEDIRPTFILPDDIDTRKDSVVEAERKFQVFTREILPMGQRGTLTLWAQNLISRFSTLFRIWKQQVRVLTNRFVTNPIPAVRDMITKVRTVNGIVKDIYISGKATWREWSKPGRIQEEIDRYGLPTFLRECQHEVEQDREGLVLQNYDDSVHVISVSQFEWMFGSRALPRYWSKYVYNDWARTKTKYHANVLGTVTVSPQNTRLPGCVFVFNPMSFNAGTAPEDVALRLLESISPTVGKGKKAKWGELIKSTLDRGGLERFVANTTRLIEERRVLLANVIPKYVDPILRSQNYQVFRCSHERTDVQRVFANVFGLPFAGTNPGSDGGVDTLNLLQRVDYNEPHPIIPNKAGYTRFFVVVPDDESRPTLTVDLEPLRMADGRIVWQPKPYTESLTPDELQDDDLFRYQCKNWRLRDPYLTAKGEIEGDILKMNDDHGNGLMMLFYDGCVQAVPLTGDERLDAAIPAGYHTEELAQRHDMTPDQQANTAWWVRRQTQKSLKGAKPKETDDFGEEIV